MWQVKRKQCLAVADFLSSTFEYSARLKEQLCLKGRREKRSRDDLIFFQEIQNAVFELGASTFVKNVF